MKRILAKVNGRKTKVTSPAQPLKSAIAVRRRSGVELVELRKEGDDARAEETLMRATNLFICYHLGPRVRRLAARTREIVRNELLPHCEDLSALIIAVAQSERVRSIERLAWSATLRPERGAIEHAEGALKSWAAVDEFEKGSGFESV